MLKAIVKFINGTDAFEGQAAAFVERSVNRATKVMERNVKVNTPVQEGHLRRSIRSRMTGQFSGEVYNEAVEGGKTINYAAFVEYGTAHMAPRAMFRKGVAQSEEQIKAIFGEEARKLKSTVVDTDAP